MKDETVEEFLKRGGKVKKLKPMPAPKWNGQFRYKMNDVKPDDLDALKLKNYRKRKKV